MAHEYFWDATSGELRRIKNFADSIVMVPRGQMFYGWGWTVGADYDFSFAPGMNLSLQTRVAADPGDDYIDAGSGNDWVAGQAGSDVIYGGDGDDILYGDDAVALPEGMAEGDDMLVGGNGADRLYGGGGDDQL